MARVDSEGFVFAITLQKDGYELIINHPVAGSSTCLYPSDPTDPPYDSEIGYASFDYYESVNTSFGVVRVSGSGPFQGCQRELTPRWNTYTKIGYIVYRVPEGYGRSTIDEMNSILQNIQYTEIK